MTVQSEDRLLMERLDRLEAKVKADEAAIQEAKRGLEFLKNTQIIRQWRSKKVGEGKQP